MVLLPLSHAYQRKKVAKFKRNIFTISPVFHFFFLTVVMTVIVFNVTFFCCCYTCVCAAVALCVVLNLCLSNFSKNLFFCCFIYVEKLFVYSIVFFHSSRYLFACTPHTHPSFTLSSQLNINSCCCSLTVFCCGRGGGGLVLATF